MPRPLSCAARNKMLSAARSIVRDRGIDAFSVDAVAASSGVAKSTIYRHFASGDELLLTALSETVGEVPDIDSGDVRRDLVDLMERYVSMATQPGIHQLFTAVMQRAANDEEFARLQQALIRERKQPLRSAVQRGIAAGLVDPSIDIDTVSLLFEGPLVAKVIHERGDFRPGEIDQIVDLVLRAVAPK